MKELEPIHLFLKQNYQDYVSLIAIGSIATEDTLIPKRSDKDILVIFQKLLINYIKEINQFLKNTALTDEYTFVPMLKDYWLKNKNHSHDFSGKFRSKTLYGED